jgi:4-amino-4-deoxy-L-arabinose transferase-like glycosyltransferase
MNTYFNPFYEHPPLAFYMESLFFRLFGDHFWVERAYSVFTYFCSGILIHFVWKQAVELFQIKKSPSWIPLLFWILFPIVSWGAVNNMLENTMTVFVLLSLLFLMISLRKHSLLSTMFAGFSLSLAFLTKGPVGLFLWSFFIFYHIVFRKDPFLKMCANTGWLVFCTLVPYFMLFLLNRAGFDSLMTYFNHQVVGSVASVQTVSSRFLILFRLLEQMILPLAILFCWGLFSWFKNHKRNSTVRFSYNNSLFFLLLALSGVLPIMISLKQSGFYILATYPLFAISIALMVVQLPEIGFGQSFSRLFSVFTVFCLLSSMGFVIYNFGAYSRDKDKICDLIKIKKFNDRVKKVNISHPLWDDWGLYGYASRYSDMDFYREEVPTQKYMLTNKVADEYPSDSVYELYPIELAKFNLFQRKSSVAKD